MTRTEDTNVLGEKKEKKEEEEEDKKNRIGKHPATTQKKANQNL